MTKPRPRITPDEWARRYRKYPATAGRPGPREPSLTPWSVYISRAAAARTHRKIVFCCASQVAKTETLFDIIGHRFDIAPVPMAYMGPTKQFLTDQLEPRLDELLKCEALIDRRAPEKLQKKTRKQVSGTSIRLVTGRSSSALKSDSLGLVVSDEVEEILANVQGAGNPIDLMDDRGTVYTDFVHVVTSTPAGGSVEVDMDVETGLHFWRPSQEGEVTSVIWQLWEQGTRYHWAWPCPDCRDYFIPRFSCLVWDKPKNDAGAELESTPALARKTAKVCCPNCGSLIDHKHKDDMNARGVFVAPGQTVGPDGVVVGSPPESSTLSYWVSGLASPFKSWADHADRYVQAVRSRDQEKVKVAKNNGFGELFAPAMKGVSDWQKVAELRRPNPRGSVPSEALFLTAGVDVQKNRLVYVIRAWGRRQTSWLIDHGAIYGDTEHDYVWLDLDQLLAARYDGLEIRRMFVDSGFRPGEPAKVPTNKVYEFCRRNKRQTYPTKGYKSRAQPVSVTKADVNTAGKYAKYGLELVHLSTDYFKSWVHARITWPDDQPGQWLLHEDVDDEYCRQIVSEVRVTRPDGDFDWLVKRKPNDFFDAEAMAYAAAHMLGVFRIADNTPPPERHYQDGRAAETSAPKKSMADYLADIGGGDDE